MPLKLTLGDFEFTGRFEAPQTLPGGGSQSIKVHEQIGGVRKIDALGRSDRDIGWNGSFIGITAEDRVRALDNMRIEANTHILSYSSFQYKVLIKSFTWDYLPNFLIDYQIVCVVIEDQTQPIKIIVPSAFDDTVLLDLIEVMDIKLLLSNPGVISTLALLNAAITNLPSLGGATDAEIAGVLAAAQNAADAVNLVLGTVKAETKNVLMARAVHKTYADSQHYSRDIEELQVKWADLANLYRLQSVLQRMQRNLQIGLTPSGQVIETVINKNLFQVAVEQYGDALQWTLLAEANDFLLRNSDGFVDPFINGTVEIVVPPMPSAKSNGLMDYD